jgi:serine/threonine-protein kinase
MNAHDRTPDRTGGSSPTIDSTQIHDAAISPAGEMPNNLSLAFRDSRYRPRKLHAHGGLGEVYVADDTELGRAVALKRIRDGRGLHTEDEIRFRREAAITGRLEHPGVVPIYGLGSDASGRPFYAMRFIEGQTLADAIDAFHRAETPGRDQGERTLALRHLLTRFVAACQAVAFAHSRGIIHRDIKPANIMLGQFGETLVVDWGLAKGAAATGEQNLETILPTNGQSSTAGQETLVAPDAAARTDGSRDSATEAGVILGTPAFMSPEQATGQWDAVGTASDIFSLGASLYQLLTGRPPYRGELTLEDAIHARYLWPRRHKADVPPELEAIVLKAMARRPGDRYPSAQALAADIEKWLGQEPVSVYREPWSKRVGRWMRRHRTLVTAVGVALLVAIVVMAIGSVWLDAARRNEAAAKKQAQALAVEVAQQRDDASAKYALARRAVDDMLTAVGEKLKTTQDVQKVRRELLQQALDFYQQFLKEKSDDPKVQRETAGAFARAAEIHQLLGDSAKAEEEYLQSIRLRTDLIQRESQPVDREKRGLAYFQLGHLYFDLLRHADAERAYRSARDEFTALSAEFPNERCHRDQLGGAVHNLARVYSATGRPADSESTYRQALAMREALVQSDSSTSYLDGLARTQFSLASVLQSTAQRDEAEKQLVKAVAAFRELSAKEPGTLDHRIMLASSLDALGTIYSQSSRFKEAAKTLNEALMLRDKLMEEQPTIPELREGYGYTLQNVTWLFKTTGRAKEAEGTLRNALQHWEKLAADFPNVPGYRGSIADTLNQLGYVLSDLNRSADAADALRRAEGIYQKLTDQHPENPWFASGLARSQNDLGIVEQDAKRYSEADGYYRKSLAIRQKLADRSPNDLDAANELGGVLCNLGNLASAQSDYAKALESYDPSIRILSAIHAKRPTDPTTKRFLLIASWNRAKALAALNRHADSLPDWDRALELATPEQKVEIQVGRSVSAVKAVKLPDQKNDKLNP